MGIETSLNYIGDYGGNSSAIGPSVPQLRVVDGGKDVVGELDLYQNVESLLLDHYSTLEEAASANEIGPEKAWMMEPLRKEIEGYVLDYLVLDIPCPDKDELKDYFLNGRQPDIKNLDYLGKINERLDKILEYRNEFVGKSDDDVVAANMVDALAQILQPIVGRLDLIYLRYVVPSQLNQSDNL